MTTLAFALVSCVGVALLLLRMCAHTDAQTGYVSIDCGSTNTTYEDSVSTLTWNNDSAYILTGLNVHLNFAVNSTLDNYIELQTLRYFPESRSKHCYELPVTSSNVSLIRAMFLQGDANELTLPITFDVSIGATNWFTVQYTLDSDVTDRNTPMVFEGVFPTPGNVVHFCLLPSMGAPFISSLELRPVTNQLSDYQYLWTALRWNTGASPGAPTVRFPSDQSDRLWSTPPSSSDISIPIYSANTDVTEDLNEVLEDAWLDDTPNSSFSPSQYTISSAMQARNMTGGGYVVVLLEEISPNATTSTVRGMEILVNDYYYLDVNVTNSGLFANHYGQVLLESLSIPSFSSLEFVFTGLPWSTLGPIVNGIEAYGQYDFDNSSTTTADVAGLKDLQTNFNLLDWQGDPCYPVPWDWVVCEYYNNTFLAQVNKILLSNWGINGTIPPSISQLDALTEIHLDNNSLSGSIPESLATLPFLTVLLLNDNNLSGVVPADLKNKTSLKNFTYFGNSLLDLAPSSSPGTPKKGSRSSAGVVIGAIAGGFLALLIVVCILIWCLKFRFRKRGTPISRVEVSGPDKREPYRNGPVVGRVPLETVLLATNNYKQKIGAGSYGSVYHGNLDGKEVAIKVNNIHSDQRSNEFINEVDILTRVHHKNLVRLLGYCNEGQQLILIYEYQANGTLREWLDNGPGEDMGAHKKPLRGFLSWEQRVQIAMDSAKGLEYLHKDCVPPVIHRDVKSSNILLDNFLVGKVADFGISKTALSENDRTSSTGLYTNIKGTYGYLDPEYFETSKLTQKSDVYSFGVVLVELISGRPAVEKLPDGSYLGLVEVLQSFVERADIKGLADPSLQDDFDVESMWRMADIALSCVQRKSENRPYMTEVVRNLPFNEQAS